MRENNNESYITQEEANERMRKFAMHTIETMEENSLMAPVALKLLSALERSMQKMVEPPPPTYQQLQAMVAVLRSNLAIEQDKQSTLEAKCAALAAENAAIKFYLRNGPVIRKGGELAAAHQFAPETPATDAFLAEVQAQGVEMYAEHLTRKAIASGENKNHAYAYLAANFASQLRQEAQ